jgi:hypothetical protein
MAVSYRASNLGLSHRLFAGGRFGLAINSALRVIIRPFLRAAKSPPNHETALIVGVASGLGRSTPTKQCEAKSVTRIIS